MIYCWKFKENMERIKDYIVYSFLSILSLSLSNKKCISFFLIFYWIAFGSVAIFSKFLLYNRIFMYNEIIPFFYLVPFVLFLWLKP